MSQSSNSKKEHSLQTQTLFQNIEKLVEEADSGKYEAKQRLEAIIKLADPNLNFSTSDYKRILDKKKLPLPVINGIEFYRMMHRLTYLVQPVDVKKGFASLVRLIDYENLTWEEFLELRGSFNAGFIFDAMKQREEPKFNGMNLLNEEQKELYGRLPVYFGGRKKPTLQNLAMALLCEEANGKKFDNSSRRNYIKAINDYLKKLKKAPGVNIFIFSVHAVTSPYNERTVRESLERWDKRVAELKKSFAATAAKAHFPKSAELQSIVSKMTEDYQSANKKI